MIIGDGTTACVYTHDNGAYVINVHTAMYRNDGRPCYVYSIYVEGACLTAGYDLFGPVDAEMNATNGFRSLLSYLTNDAEHYRYYMGSTAPVEGYTFSEKVAEWAYGVSDELELLALAFGEQP